MMKKFSAIAMILTAAVSLSACAHVDVLLPYSGSPVYPAKDAETEKTEEQEKKPEKEAVAEKPAEEPVEEEDDSWKLEEADWMEGGEDEASDIVRIFEPGIVEGNVYENLTLQIGLNAPDGWTFQTAEEMAKTNKLKEEATTESVTAYLEEPVEYIDVDLISRGIGNEISISVINDKFISKDQTLEEIAQDACVSLEEQLAEKKYEQIQSEVQQIPFLGETLYASTATSVNQGTQVKEIQLHNIHNNYFYTITVVCFGEQADPIALLENFYALQGEAA